MRPLVLFATAAADLEAVAPFVIFSLWLGLIVDWAAIR